MITAGEAVLGALDEATTLAADARAAADPAFAAEMARWQERLMPLSLAVAPVAPDDDLLGRIDAKLDAVEKMKALSRTLRSDEGKWIMLTPGVMSKLLWRDATARRQSILLSVEPGSTLAEHDHDHGEETIYMISGDLSFAGTTLRPGDLHVSAAGSAHARAVSKTGCLCIVTGGY
jgi:quercetin dioxygenase-like cupin family protein